MLGYDITHKATWKFRHSYWARATGYRVAPHGLLPPSYKALALRVRRQTTYVGCLHRSGVLSWFLMKALSSRVK